MFFAAAICTEFEGLYDLHGFKPNMMLSRALAWIAQKGGSVVESKEEGIGRDRLRVSCGKHEWTARLSNLAYNHSWCPACYGNVPHTIEMMRKLAEERGGQCLSEEYHGLTKHLTWKCAHDHKWRATPNNVKNCGSWCPHCIVNIGEELTRLALQEAFPGHEFKRTRAVPWMGGLEFDGFDEELRLAFEYQGKQHSQLVKHMQRKEGDFEKQQERDQRKREACVANEWTLIEITHEVPFAKIRSTVRAQLEDLGYPIGPIVYGDTELFNRVYTKGTTNEYQFAKALEIIARKGGICLSERYVGYDAPLTIKCGAGHTFTMSLGGMDQPESRGPRFCQFCAGTMKKEDEEIKQTVEKRGYTYLSHERVVDNGGKPRIRLRMICPVNHQIERMPWDSFTAKPPKNCEECGNKKKGAHMKADGARWGAQYGLNLLDDEYKNKDTAHEWRCEREHQFFAKLQGMNDKIKKGHKPCAACELQEYAERNDLTLIDQWTNDSLATDKLQWKCNKCDTVFGLSKMTMARSKKKLCPKCKTVAQ